MNTIDNHPVICENTYNPGHPWYYILGGTIQRPKQILDCVKENGYQGYMADDIHKVAKKPEPQRSAELRRIKTKVLDEFRDDLARYRTLAHALRGERLQYGIISEHPVCKDIHTAISLKYNHLYNDFAHLLLLDDVITIQADLFSAL